MAISHGFLRVAELLEAAAMPLAHSTLHKHISQAVRDAHPNEYADLVDVAGDEKSGHAVYSKGYNGKLRKAPYTATSKDGAPSVKVDTAKAVDVTPRTSYDEIPDDSAAAAESRRTIAAASGSM